MIKLLLFIDHDTNPMITIEDFIYLTELKIARQMFLDLKYSSSIANRSIVDLDILSIDQSIQLIVKDEELIRLSPDDIMLFGIAHILIKNYN
jgi:hypothetical protein